MGLTGVTTYQVITYGIDFLEREQKPKGIELIILASTLFV